jgi:hypothetical protein
MPSLRSSSDGQTEDGWPFRVAFTIGTIAFFLNRAASSPFNDFDVFIVAGLLAFLASVYWPLIRFHRFAFRGSRSVPSSEAEDLCQKNFCPCCGQPLSQKVTSDG